MIDNPIIFYPSAVLIILFAIVTLFARNIIYSMLSAIIVFFFGALFFYVLGSEYNAIIQAAIYGLAVPIIIGISIMFCSPYSKKEKAEGKNKFLTPYLTILSGGIFLLAFIYLVLMSLAMNPSTFHYLGNLQVNSFDTIWTFAKGIFINYVWAFELISLLLLIVIAGFSMLKRRGI